MQRAGQYAAVWSRRLPDHCSVGPSDPAGGASVKHVSTMFHSPPFRKPTPQRTVFPTPPMRTFCAAVEKTRPRSIRCTSIVQLRSFPRPRQENAYRRRTGFCIAQFPMRLRKTRITAIQAPAAQPCIRPAPRSISRGDYTTFAAVRKVPSIRLSLPLAMRTVGAASAADHLGGAAAPRRAGQGSPALP